MTEKFNDGQELQVKSKERVKDFGEVFTNPREVNAMLDLVKDESYRVDSRFLEPACGNGNFLVAILDRKMQTVLEAHNVDKADFEKYTFIAVSSIYAIDIQRDNCEESRERMYNIVKDYYDEVYPDNQDDNFLDSIKYILELNVILGNGLTGLQVDEDNQDGYVDRPIVFSEFTFDGDLVIRKDFAMNDMIAHENNLKTNNQVMNQGLFAGLNKEEKAEEKLKPMREFAPVDFRKLNYGGVK